jgi:hypothetical protein
MEEGMKDESKRISDNQGSVRRGYNQTKEKS